MSIKVLVAKKINDLRDKIQLWESPSASLEQKRAVLASLVGNDPEFWGAVVKVASRDHKLAKKATPVPKPAVTAEPAVIATPPALKPDMPASTSPAPTPGPAATSRKFLPATGQARTLGLVTKTSKPGASVFGAKLSDVAKEVGLEDHSIIGRFRSVISEKGKGSEYWDLCRDVTKDALRGAEFTMADWDLLVEKMKFNLFFTGEIGDLFIERCPKEKLADLRENLTGLVASIRKEEKESVSSTYQVDFALGVSLKGGREGRDLRTSCLHAINRMLQKRFISSGHWLAKKAAQLRADSMAQRKPIPAEKFAPPENVPVEVPAPVSAPAEPVVIAPIEDGDKPVLEPAVATELETAFLAAEGAMTDDELEKLTAPEVSMAS